jgi:tungstate transport system substrate-binding protein
MGSTDIGAAFKTLKSKGIPFISRGDRSGTHIAELALWKAAGIDIAAEKGPWYKEIGQGMGAALNTAAASNAYVLSDRGTWLSFKNKGDLVIAVQGDKRLFNQYGVMLVNPQKHPTVKKELASNSSTGCSPPRGSTTSPATRSMASSSSIRTPAIRPRDGHITPRAPRRDTRIAAHNLRVRKQISGIPDICFLDGGWRTTILCIAT